MSFLSGVLDFPEDMDLKDPNLEITFDFEFLDDTYSSAACSFSRSDSGPAFGSLVLFSTCSTV